MRWPRFRPQDCEPEEIEESLADFIEEYAGSEEAAAELTSKIKLLKVRVDTDRFRSPLAPDALTSAVQRFHCFDAAFRWATPRRAWPRRSPKDR